MTWTCPEPACQLMLHFSGDGGAYLYLVRLYHEQMGIHESPFEIVAHQAECGCHPMVRMVGPPENCCDRLDDADARDFSGQPWHVDPLCKVRPEAKA